MENKDPLFENIRRNSSKIEQVPSRDAWTKLEARLDKYERPAARRRRLPGRNMLSVAASVLLLVGLVFVISQTILKQDNAMAMKKRQAMPHQVEDLPLLVSNQDINSPQMVEYQRKINANPRGIIKEGGYHKKLVAQSKNRGQQISSENDKHATSQYVVTMDNFDWILGTWKSTTPNGISTEIWRITGPGYFSGTGRFTNPENTSVFTEEMELFEKNNIIYFTATTQSAGEKVRYRLQSLENNQAVFYNDQVEFPSHVMMIRNGAGGFTITFKNIPPVVVPDKNILLNNKRNTLKGKEIIRTMEQKI